MRVVGVTGAASTDRSTVGFNRRPNTTAHATRPIATPDTSFFDARTASDQLCAMYQIAQPTNPITSAKPTDAAVAGDRPSNCSRAPTGPPRLDPE